MERYTFGDRVYMSTAGALFVGLLKVLHSREPELFDLVIEEALKELDDGRSDYGSLMLEQAIKEQIQGIASFIKLK